MRYAKKPLSKTAVVFVFSQFPMGKVKSKGAAEMANAIKEYQFPMGKVKITNLL